MNTFGKNVKISLFGELYGKNIGITIDGLPPGYPININKLKKSLEEIYRKNKSIFKFDISNLSNIYGLSNKMTTGSPITIIIESNLSKNDFKDGTIIPDLLDYSTYIKYYGTENLDKSLFHNHHILKLIIIVGEIIKQILSSYKVDIASRIYCLKNIKDEEINYEDLSFTQFLTMIDDSFPMINKRAVLACNGEIKKTKAINESFGGIVETFIFNPPSSLGEPLFDGFESCLSKLLFSIPYIRGITFGDIVQDIRKSGSKCIDELEYNNNQLIFCSNHQSGLNSGITNGNMIYFKTYVKAPSNIPKNIKSVNVLTKQNIELYSSTDYALSYLFDTIYLVEALSYIVLIDLLIENNKAKGV